MATKKQKQAFVIIATLIVLIGMAIWLQPFAIGGVTPLSLGKVTTVTDGVMGQSWLVSVSTAPSSFVLTGALSADKIQADSGVAPNGGFDIGVTVDQSVMFPITAETTFITDYYIRKSPSYSCTSLTEAKYADPSAWFYFHQKPFGITCTDYNVYAVSHGRPGIVNAQASFPSKINVQVVGGGKTTTTTIDNSIEGAKPLYYGGAQIGRVDYAGDLVNSASVKPEIFQSYKPLNKDGVWYFTQMANWNAYTATGALNAQDVRNKIIACFNTDISGFDIATCADQYHNAYVGLTQATVTGLQGITSMTDPTTGKSGVFAKFTADRLYYFPQLSFLLDVDWVGIKKLVGTPSITSVQSSTCTSGSRGIISATVKNIGTGSGTFETAMVCPKFEEFTSVYTDTFSAGMTKTYQFYYDANVDIITTDTCTVSSMDKGSFVKVTKTVSATCNPTVICIANTQNCEQGIIKKCNAEGTEITNAGTCAVCGDAKCEADEKSTCSKDCGPDLVCQDKLGGLIPSKLVKTQECGVFCNLGFTSATTVGQCVEDYTIVFIIGFVVIVGLLLYFRFGRGQTKSKGFSL